MFLDQDLHVLVEMDPPLSRCVFFFKKNMHQNRFNLSPFPRGPRLQHLDLGTLCLAPTIWTDGVLSFFYNRNKISIQ